MRGPIPRDLSLAARIVDGIRWRLGRFGIYVTAMVTIQEGASGHTTVPIGATYRYGELTRSDVDELVRLEPNYSRERLYGWFDDGRLCFGLWEGTRLVAKMWCDLHEVCDPTARRMLAPGEAYLFAAYSDPAFRGRNLAPMLRSACYERLRQRGFDRFYSLSEYFNLPARRFKQKLGAVEKELFVEVRLKGGWRRSFTLKRYR